MNSALRWSAAVFASLAWLFFARLLADQLSAHALTPVWFVPPVVVIALRLPHRAALVSIALVALLHDATLGIRFGLTASLVLPVAALLLRTRRHLNVRSRRQAAAIAFALTPTLHLAYAVALSVTGEVLPADPAGLTGEIAIGAVAAALATPWLGAFTDALLHKFGAESHLEEPA